MNVVSLTLYFLIGSMYSIYLNNEELEKASIDDNADVRKGWNLGHTINANEDIISALAELLEF